MVQTERDTKYNTKSMHHKVCAKNHSILSSYMYPIKSSGHHIGSVNNSARCSSPPNQAYMYMYIYAQPVSVVWALVYWTTHLLYIVHVYMYHTYWIVTLVITFEFNSTNGLLLLWQCYIYMGHSYLYHDKPKLQRHRQGITANNTAKIWCIFYDSLETRAMIDI